MSMFRKLILAAGVAAVPLAFAAGAKAANPDGQGVVLYNAAGVPVAILTPIQHETRVAAVAAAGEDPASRMIRRIEAATVPDDAFFPFTQIMAEQDRMMHAVMAQMRGMMAGAVRSTAMERPRRRCPPVRARGRS